MEELSQGFWTLKRKLYGFIIVLLTIPFFSVSFLQQLESSLTANLLSSLERFSSSLAFALEQNALNHSQLSQAQGALQTQSEPAIYVPMISQATQIDGYDDDWYALSGYELSIAQDQLRVLLASDDKFIYVLLTVQDAAVVYQDSIDGSGASDSIELSLADAQGNQAAMTFAPVAVGKVTPLMATNFAEPFWISNAFWQETASGYVLEVKIPKRQKWTSLGVKVKQVSPDVATPQFIQSYTKQFNPLHWPDPYLVATLDQLNLQSGQRVWVLDRLGDVKARRGQLAKDIQFARVNPLIHFLLSPPESNFNDPRERAIALDNPVVTQALGGKVASDIETVKGASTAIAMVATPLYKEQQLVGVLVIEESVAAVQVMQQEALNIFINSLLLSLLLVVVVLIFLASRLTSRIVKLNRQAQQAVDKFGRVKQSFQPESSRDEIGQLSQSFSAMTLRLSDYNEYLEKLAARLSHELRTPIAVVRSSIDAIAMSASSEQESALQHAQQGIERLSQMITRMREATRMEQSVLAVPLEPVAIESFVRDYCAAAQPLFAHHTLSVSASGTAQPVNVSQELLAQMLDKLLSNARDFATDNSAIEIVIEFFSGSVLIAVVNQGPGLPALSERELFASMVSERDVSKRSDEQAHMGLGLYLVRLIAERCNGRYFARNWYQQSRLRDLVTANPSLELERMVDGVAIGVILPIQR